MVSAWITKRIGLPFADGKTKGRAVFWGPERTKGSALGMLTLRHFYKTLVAIPSEGPS